MEISAQLQLGKFDFQPKQAAPDFKVFAETWFNTTVKATCKPSTVADYEGILNNHLYPAFENTPITEINRGKIKEFLLGKLNEGFSHSTVGHMKNVLSGVLAQALDHEIVQANPALGIKKIANGRAKAEAVNPLTDAELDLLLQAVYHSKKYQEHFCLYPAAGEDRDEIGEALALQWGDIDFNGRFIEVTTLDRARRNLDPQERQTPARWT